MNKQRALWIVLWSAMLLLVAAGLSMLIPGSPFYLPSVFEGDSEFMKGRTVRHLLDVVDGSDEDARAEALQELGGMGPDASQAVPRLAKILAESNSRRDRIQASLALTKILSGEGEAKKRPAGTDAAVTAMAKGLSDEDGFVRMNCALALGELRQEARPAVPALIKAVNDKSNQTNLNRFLHTIQEQVALALGRASAGTDEGVSALIEALQAVRNDKTQIKDKGQAQVHAYHVYRAKIALARALADIGPPARPAMSLLQEMAKEDKNPDDEFRVKATEAIQKIDGKLAAAK
jgi:HEAT repeat protein